MRIHNGNSFYMKEYQAWSSTQSPGTKLSLHCVDAGLLRNRIIKYAIKNNHQLSTKKLTCSLLEITYNGPIQY